jgi:ABC-2 type transport system ATP-binding protein
LILDEPTSGLDPIQIRQTLETIRDLRRQHTVLLSTHILSEVEAVCERVIIVNYGRIGLDKRLNDLDTEAPVIVLEVRGPIQEVTDVLKSADNVADVRPQPLEDGLAAFEVRGDRGQDLREALGQRIARNGWSLRKLDIRRRKLEDHFLDVVVRAQSTFTAFRKAEPPPDTAVTTSPAPSTAPPSPPPTEPEPEPKTEIKAAEEGPMKNEAKTDERPAPAGGRKSKKRRR